MNYRKVDASERLPDEDGMYIVGFGSAVTQARWYPNITQWVFNQYTIEWWLELIPEITEGKIENIFRLNSELNIEVKCAIMRMDGFKAALKELKKLIDGKE